MEHNNVEFLRHTIEATEAALKKNPFMGKLQPMKLEQYVTDMRTLLAEVDRLEGLLEQSQSLR